MYWARYVVVDQALLGGGMRSTVCPSSYEKLHNKFEFQGVLSIFHRIMPFWDFKNITSVGNMYCKAILAVVYYPRRR